MNICENCIDYDHESNICVPSGEVAGNAVVYCADKRLYVSTADYIRDLSDEELVEFFAKYMECGECKAYCAHCMADEKNCKQALLVWLKSENVEANVH